MSQIQSPSLNKVYNQDCISGMKNIPSESIDLIVTDPPFAIKFDGKQGNYGRDSSKVLDGYVEIPKEDYPKFSLDWITESYRVLKDSGSMYVFSGFNNMKDILNALDSVGFTLQSNVIWEYPFGLYAKKNFVVSHYNIFYVCKNPKKRIFNSDCRFSNSKPRYHDLISVWKIKKEFWKGKKTPTKLPTEIIKKILQYSSNPGDLVLDPFSGSGQVLTTSKSLGRNYLGFEIVPGYFEFIQERLTMEEEK